MIPIHRASLNMLGKYCECAEPIWQFYTWSTVCRKFHNTMFSHVLWKKTADNLRILWAMLFSDPVPAQCVVVETRVLHQCYPFSPARRHIRAIILIQILPKKGCNRYGLFWDLNWKKCMNIIQYCKNTVYIDPGCLLTCPVAWIVEVDGKSVWFMVGLPGRWWAVLVVGVRVVVVHIFPSQDGGSRRAAHRSGGKRIGEVGAALHHYALCFVHGLHGAFREKTGNICGFKKEGDRAKEIQIVLCNRCLTINFLPKRVRVKSLNKDQQWGHYVATSVIKVPKIE